MPLKDNHRNCDKNNNNGHNGSNIRGGTSTDTTNSKLPCPAIGCGRLYRTAASLRNHLRRYHPERYMLGTASSSVQQVTREKSDNHYRRHRVSSKKDKGKLLKLSTSGSCSDDPHHHHQDEFDSKITAVIANQNIHTSSNDAESFLERLLIQANNSTPDHHGSISPTNNSTKTHGSSTSTPSLNHDDTCGDGQQWPPGSAVADSEHSSTQWTTPLPVMTSNMLSSRSSVTSPNETSWTDVQGAALFISLDSFFTQQQYQRRPTHHHEPTNTTTTDNDINLQRIPTDPNYFDEHTNNRHNPNNTNTVIHNNLTSNHSHTVLQPLGRCSSLSIHHSSTVNDYYLQELVDSAIQTSSSLQLQDHGNSEVGRQLTSTSSVRSSNAAAEITAIPIPPPPQSNSTFPIFDSTMNVRIKRGRSLSTSDIFTRLPGQNNQSHLQQLPLTCMSEDNIHQQQSAVTTNLADAQHESLLDNALRAYQRSAPTSEAPSDSESFNTPPRFKNPSNNTYNSQVTNTLSISPLSTIRTPQLRAHFSSCPQSPLAMLSPGVDRDTTNSPLQWQYPHLSSVLSVQPTQQISPQPPSRPSSYNGSNTSNSNSLATECVQVMNAVESMSGHDLIQFLRELSQQRQQLLQDQIH